MRKLTYLRKLVADLAPFEGATLAIDLAILRDSIGPALRDWTIFQSLKRASMLRKRPNLLLS
jgi:hypothetical protein